MARYRTVFCMHGILMGQGLGDSCQNHRTGNFETAFSQSGPQVLVGTACQETPPTLPTHCYEELVPRYDVRERPHHRMPKSYNTPRPRELLPEATQYKAETTHNTTLRLHNTTQKLPGPTPSLPWQPEAAQCSPEAAHHNPEAAADTLGADHRNPEVTQDIPKPPNTIPKPPNITPGLPNASHAADYHLEVVQYNPRAMLFGNDQSRRFQN